MIEQDVLKSYKRKLEKGGRLHGHDQMQLVMELMHLQIKNAERDSKLEVRNIELEKANRALRVQVVELNRTISLLNGRGKRTAGTYESPDAEHGAVHKWPEEVWGPMTGDGSGITCDWGGCDNLATLARYDAHGHGWLPCCEDCSLLPV